jgi:hypothetical protein
MYDVVTNLNDGTITISDVFDINAATGSVGATPYFYQPEDEYVISFTNLQNVTEFTKFQYDTLGLSDERFLLQYYRVSRDGISWSDWFDLKRFIDNFPVIDPLDPLFVDIKWVRKGDSLLGDIRMLEYKLEGELLRAVDDGDVVSIPTSETKIIKPPFIYKVFNITDLEIISPSHQTGLPDGLILEYRYSQDSSRSWSEWEPLTKENITTVNINPIRFFQIEYSITNNSGQLVSIQDINLIGDFQNVTNDSQKSNLFGIRECCLSNMNGTFDSNGNFIPNENLNSGGGGAGGSGDGSGGSCDTSGLNDKMSDQEKANLYNPYQQNTASKLLTKLSSDAEQVFGHKILYFVTDPDKKGQDHTLNEYQLFNVVCEGEVKISIEGNNFPDSQIVMNQFDLNLFETMEAHITKQQFKEIFGVQRRPSKEDFLYFCNVNRMYQVDHAQQFRNFNNSAVYYKLILKKYTQKANVQAGTIDIQNKLDKLTKNTTIDELMGIEQTKDKAAIANKQQFTPLTRDPIRLEYNAQIDKELVENSSTIIAKAHYDLSSVNYRSSAVSYKNLDPIFKVSDNIGFQVWFNMNNYIQDEIYNFMSHYDTSTSLGWRAELSNDTITITLNSDTYVFNLTPYTTGSDPTGLEEETWYCYVLNIDQRNRKMDQYIYKRDVDYEEDAPTLPTTLLRKVYQDTQTIVPIEYELLNFNPEILASDMKITNIRMFLDVIPENVHNKILNQYIIRDDSKYLVFADNATTRLYLPKFPLFE